MLIHGHVCIDYLIERVHVHLFSEPNLSTHTMSSRMDGGFQQLLMAGKTHLQQFKAEHDLASSLNKFPSCRAHNFR